MVWARIGIKRELRYAERREKEVMSTIAKYEYLMLRSSLTYLTASSRATREEEDKKAE